MKNILKNIFLTIFIGVIFFTVFFYSLHEFNKLSYFNNSNIYLSDISNSIFGTQTKPSGFPARLSIPSINVDAPIIQVGLTADGSVDTPKGADEVAWFNLGPKPGEMGSSVIVGHYGLWKNGEHSVFDNLNKLEKGSKIYVTNDKGSKVSFAVREIRTYNPGDSVPDIFYRKDGTYLNLITCGGTWIPGMQTYNKRLVIFANLIE